MTSFRLLTFISTCAKSYLYLERKTDAKYRSTDLNARSCKVCKKSGGDEFSPSINGWMNGLNVRSWQEDGKCVTIITNHVDNKPIGLSMSFTVEHGDIMIRYAYHTVNDDIFSGAHFSLRPDAYLNCQECDKVIDYELGGLFSTATKMCVFKESSDTVVTYKNADLDIPDDSGLRQPEAIRYIKNASRRNNRGHALICHFNDDEKLMLVTRNLRYLDHDESNA